MMIQAKNDLIEQNYAHRSITSEWRKQAESLGMNHTDAARIRGNSGRCRASTIAGKAGADRLMMNEAIGNWSNTSSQAGRYSHRALVDNYHELMQTLSATDQDKIIENLKIEIESNHK